MRPPWRRLGLLGLLVPLLAWGCVSRGVEPPPTSELPRFLMAASSEIRELYAYALSHPELLAYIPCYCGCVDIGHGNNRDCYIQQVSADGSVVYDRHGYG